MKIPSLTEIINKGKESTVRFPVVLFFAFAGTLVSLYLAENGFRNNDFLPYLEKIILCCALAIPLQISLGILSERLQLGRYHWLAVNFAGFVFILPYYFLLPATLTGIHYISSFVFSLAFHLCVSYIAFIAKNNTPAFWEFNKALFLRFITAVFYAMVLYAGLSIALLSAQFLFNIDIKGERYFQLYIIIVGVFNTWFFIAGIPKSYAEQHKSYPNALRVFSHFILIPLVLLYLLIVYLYMAKIIILWEWPVGWVSNLVAGVSGVGIFSLLLIYPLSALPGNDLIKKYQKAFYVMLIPLSVLMLLAVFRRVNDYGFTEYRYYAMLTALWIAAIALYMLLNKRNNIKAIPFSLSILLVFTLIGPWSSFNISKTSQINRFEKVLAKNNLLADGKIIPKEDHVDIDHLDMAEINSIAEYLVGTHGTSSLQPFFTHNLDSLTKEQGRYAKTYTILASVNLSYYRGNIHDKETGKSFYLSAENETEKVIHISGYDYQLSYAAHLYYRDNDNAKKYLLGENNLEVSFDLRTTELILKLDAKPAFKIQLEEIIRNAIAYSEKHTYNAYSIPTELLTIEKKGTQAGIKLLISSASGSYTNEKLNLSDIRLSLYVSLQ